ncbi:hypothetical protein [Variovorax sp. V15]|uniref:hypothetical protein n=1 Tax=unclassified Variovorax TaxID=663243 RepID=UPI0034E8B7D9
MPWHSHGVNAPKSCCFIAGNPGISLGANVIPCTGRLAEVEGFEREAGELVRAFLEAHRGELRCDLDLGLATTGARSILTSSRSWSGVDAFDLSQFHQFAAFQRLLKS